ncbi:MAG: hypothetical protein JWP95_1173, partial [Actinotalea sp.]|nr:hypothetical protein [Actinotalea sp.]
RRKRSVFLSVAAQSDNLGDIEIRQVSMDFAASGGAELNVFIGTMPPAYVAAFDFPVGTKLHTSGSGFALKTFAAAAVGRAHLMISPGPYVLPHGKGHLKGGALLLAVLVVRASGGSVAVAGRAFRGSGRLGRFVQRAIARLSTVFVARDLLSADVLRAPISHAPDLALATEREAVSREVVVISFRSDHAVDVAVVRQIVLESRSHGLVPILVSQVRRDDVQHLSLGRLLDAEVVEWGARDHREQLRRVREVYARASWVFSDRLHAVIFGLQHSALPVAVSQNPRDKVVATLQHLVPLAVVDTSIYVPGMGLGMDWGDEVAGRKNLDLAMKAVRDELGDLRLDVGEVFAP